MNYLDACRDLDQLFPDVVFSMEIWRGYMNGLVPGLADFLQKDSREYDFRLQSLPVIQDALVQKRKRAQASASFEMVMNGLDDRIWDLFHCRLDVEVILYLGLCNGAGFVTTCGEKTFVLLGIEKIIELDWCSLDDMQGLVWHELGHVYQKQFGKLECDFEDPSDRFLWQLFTEGTAMCFEQMLAGDSEYYHQDKNGWKTYMDSHFTQLKRDFQHDLPDMKQRNQRYFGDWVDYHGYGDAGYYLGAKFMQYVLKNHSFNDILSLDIAEVRKLFFDFVEAE